MVRIEFIIHACTVCTCVCTSIYGFWVGIFRYLGFSWANGIVALNLNGRNQESSSEAVSAYEAVALFGDVIVNVFNQDTPEDMSRRALGARINNMGRLLYGLYCTACCYCCDVCVCVFYFFILFSN